MFLEKCSHPLPRLSWSFFCKFFAIVFLCLLIGCGMMMNNSMPSGMTASFAFVSNTGSGSVSAFAVSTTGMLTPVSGSPFMAGAGAEFMAFDAVHKFLFVSNQGGNTVSAFSVSTSTGMLTAIAGSPFTTGARPIGIAVDPMGRFGSVLTLCC
jgi:DNA-binding beta-propeller fold protein YncE